MPSPTRPARLRPATLSLALASAFAAVAPQLHANPAGGVAVHGAATMVANGNQLLVTTQNGAGTSHSVINWQSFSIPAGNSTRFQQPDAASTSINRVLANNPSSILGTLSSNGRLVLVNPAGITVGAGAAVDTAGFTAAVMRMSDADAKAGRLRFNADGVTGSLSVQGNIIARGGDVVLIAPNAEVAQGAVVESQGGSTVLVAGQQVEVTGRGLEGIQLQVRAPGDQAVNLGTLKGNAVGIFASNLRHSGLIQATGVALEGGKVVLRATEVADVSGRIEARRLSEAAAQGGSITVQAGIAVLGGALDARGTSGAGAGGSVTVQADGIIQSGSVDASGVRTGGVVTLDASRSILQTAEATVRADATDGSAGVVAVRAGADAGVLMTSAQISASGAGEQGAGGMVQLLGNTVRLQAAQVQADGDATGGTVLVGGDRQGQNPALPHSRHLYVNSASQLSANARRRGNAGTVVLWSDGDTRFFGNIQAKGAGEGGSGGSVEVSGKDSVQFGGMVEAAGGPGGANGTLLLDPKNITVAASAGGLSIMELADPNVESGTLAGSFGSLIANLDSARVLVTDPNDSAGGTNAGAIYIFNRQTGALQTALTGSHANDQIGSDCTQINGGFCGYGSITAPAVFRSSTWNGGVGAWTFFNPASTLPSGVVSAANSLVGTAVGDFASASIYQVSAPVVNAPGTGAGVAATTINPSGAYTSLLIAPYYAGGRGAVANVDLYSGAVGTLSTSNALMGSLPGDNIGSSGYSYQSSTQWLLQSPSWNSGSGALTLFNPGAVVPGTVSAANSLVGSAPGDRIGANYTMSTISNGKLLIASLGWGGGKGAFTVKNGIADMTGVVDATNSLVGTSTTDGANFNFCGFTYYSACVSAGSGNPTPSQSVVLTNAAWNGNMGAVTVFDGNRAAPVGPISASNSLVGSTAGDRIGNLTTVRSDGSITVYAPDWTRGTVASAGAITLGHLSNFATGAVGDGNSIVGTATGDLANVSMFGQEYNDYLAGKLLIAAPNYGGGLSGGTGAVAIVNLPNGGSAAPAAGTLTKSNALVGTTAGDHVGANISLQSSGAVILNTPNWSNGTVASAGALTFTHLLNFAVGEVGAANSIVGQSAGDLAGIKTYTPDDNGWLASDSILLLAPNYGGGTASSAKGAAAMFALPDGVTTPFSGPLTSANALVGGQAGDSIGSGGVDISSGKTWMLRSPSWSNGTLAAAGAVTFFNPGDRSSWRNGVVSASNSWVGSIANSGLGVAQNNTLVNFSNGNLLLVNKGWDNGRVAITAIAATAATAGGTISNTNSYFGSPFQDGFFNDVFTFDNSGNPYGAVQNAVVFNPQWNDGRGSVTYFNEAQNFATLTSGGPISASNSLVGSTRLDWVGQGGISLLAAVGGQAPVVVVRSPNWQRNGTLAAAGAYTFFNATLGAGTGAVGGANSLIGNSANALSGSTLYLSSTYDWRITGSGTPATPTYTQGWVPAGRGVLVAPSYTSGAGAMVLFDVTNPGVGASAYLGASTNDRLGSDGIQTLSIASRPGAFVLKSSSFGSGAGALTFADAGSTAPVSLVVGSGNSLVGSSTLDGLGGFQTMLTEISGPSDSRLLVVNRAAKGSITLVPSVVGMAGQISSANSLVGSTAGDLFTSTVQVDPSMSGRYFVNMPAWDNGNAANAGAITAIDTNSVNVPAGAIGASNSLVGTTAGDAVGAYGVLNVPGAGLYIQTPSWSNGTLAYAGAMTFFNTTMPTGAVGGGNSIIGTAFNDLSDAYLASGYLSNQRLLVAPSYGGGKGAVRLLDFSPTTDRGVLDSSNALVGAATGDRVGSGGYGPSMGPSQKYFTLLSPSVASGAGAVTVLDLSQGAAGMPLGVVGASNSLVGAAAGDSVGSAYSDITPFDNGKFMLLTRNWGGGKGAITLVQSPLNARGVVDSSNSLVGVAAGDGAGMTVNVSDDQYTNYYYSARTRAVVYSSGFNGARGMVTLIDSSRASAPAGVISASNSLVGSVAGDTVGSLIKFLPGSGLAVQSQNWNGQRGALTFSPVGSFITGEVSAANSLVGVNAGDQVGNFYTNLSSYSVGSGGTAYSGFYYINPYFNGGAGSVSFVPMSGLSGAVSSANSVLGTGVGRGAASIDARADGDLVRVRFFTGSGRVVYVDPRTSGTAGYSGGLGFGDAPDKDVTITPQTITALANAGTQVNLQANNDIVVTAPISIAANANVTAPGGLKLEAGRSVLIGANIDAGGSSLALIANSQLAQPLYRDAGAAQIRTASGVTLTNLGGFIGALMDIGTGGDGGNIELGSVQAAGLEIRNWSGTSGAGIRQTAGTQWQTTALRMETRSATGAIGTLDVPITFGASWLAARTQGGPADLRGTAASLTISDQVPDVGPQRSGSGTGSGGNDPRSFDNFYGLTTTGVGSVALRTAGDLSIVANTGAVDVAAQNLALQARSISLQAKAAPVRVVARGALELRTTGDIALQAGTAAGAYASVVSAKNAFIVAGGRLGLKGGSGKGSYALIDPTDTGSGMTVSVASVNLQGGSGDGAYSALVSAGGSMSLSAASVTLAAGTGADADAVILAPNSRDLVTSYGGTDLGSSGNPLGNGKTESGFGVPAAVSVVQQAAATLLTLQSSNLLDTFITLWKKEKARQAQGEVVVDTGTCSRGS